MQTRKSEAFLRHFLRENGVVREKKKSSKPLRLLDLLAERMGFEPMCACAQTDFESFQPL